MASYNTGLALGAIKKYSKAIDHFKAILNKEEHFPLLGDHFLSDVRRNIGFVLARIERDEKKVIGYFEAALENDDSAYTWNSKGYTLNLFGERRIHSSDNSQKLYAKPKEYFMEAAKCFNKAIEIEPDLPSAWRNKGYALKSLAKIEVTPEDVLYVVGNEFILTYQAKGYDPKKAQDKIKELLYTLSIKCIDKAILFHGVPNAWESKNLAYAWNYKGYVLSEFVDNIDTERKNEKYHEAAVCFDEAIKIAKKR